MAKAYEMHSQISILVRLVGCTAQRLGDRGGADSQISIEVVVHGRMQVVRNLDMNLCGWIHVVGQV